MKRTSIWQEIELQLREDKKFNSSYPDHVCARAGRVVIEAGDIMNAADTLKYYPSEIQEAHLKHKADLRKAAIRTAAAAIRFLENIDK